MNNFIVILIRILLKILLLAETKTKKLNLDLLAGTKTENIFTCENKVKHIILLRKTKYLDILTCGNKAKDFFSLGKTTKR